MPGPGRGNLICFSGQIVLKRFAMKQELGQMLVADGLLTQEQLKEAIYNQVIFGGKLGTNLLELGYLDEETLARYLARQHRVKSIRLEDLSNIHPSVIKLLARRLAEKYLALPVRLEGKKLYVVMANPSEMGALSELSFVTGKVIVPLVLPEVRIFDLLNNYYSIGRELRYINIAMMESERRKKMAKPIGKITPKKLEKARPEDEFKKKIIAESGAELISEKEFDRLTTSYYQSQKAEATPQAPQAQPPSPAAPEKTILDAVPPLPAVDLPPLAQVPPPPALDQTQLKRPAPADVTRVVLKPAAPALEEAKPEQPFRPVAYAIYRELVKAEVPNQIPIPRLQDFLKSYVMAELKDFMLPLKSLVNFLKSEGGIEESRINQLIDNIVNLESTLKVMMQKPAEEMPLEKEEEPVELEEMMELEPLAEEPAMEYLPEIEQVPEEVVEEVEPEIPQLSFAEATKELMEKTKDRDGLARAVIGFAKSVFKRSVLFTVRGEQVFGWYGQGEGISVKQVQKLFIPLTEPSLFKTVAQLSCHYLGPVIAQPENQKFLEAMGGAKPNSVFLIPIIWKEKVVYILYGDNGHGQNAPFDIGELLILAQKLPSAIERLIEEKKKQYQVIQGGKQG